MMRQTVWAFALFGLAMVPSANACFAEGALAIGLPDGNPRNGFVMGAATNRTTAAEARSQALAECRGSDVRDTSKARAQCKVVETFHDQCTNDAFNGDANTPSTAVGWAVGPDSETTNQRAMTMCETMRQGRGRPCHPVGDPICDGSAK
jgi:hypothetical protein